MDRMSITTLKGGAVAEMADEAIQRVMENIVDPNTDATAKRKITMVLTIAPDEDREDLAIKIDVKTTMAPHASLNAKGWVAHTKDGIIAAEVNPKQRRLYDDEQPEADDSSVTSIEEGRAK